MSEKRYIVALVDANGSATHHWSDLEISGCSECGYGSDYIAWSSGLHPPKRYKTRELAEQARENLAALVASHLRVAVLADRGER